MNADEISPESAAVAVKSPNAQVIYTDSTYYGISPVKHSTYNWIIGASYFSIGLAGASQLLGTVLDFSKMPDKEPMVRAGRYAALAGSLITPLLYTSELGVPRKWYHMLRIYRSTSLMSVGGVWLLTAFGSLSGAVALSQALEDRGYRPAGGRLPTIFGIPAALAGAFMSMYMGTELEETSTPLWAQSSPMLATLFALSNASNGLALFELTGEASHTDEESLQPVRFLAILTETAALIQLRMIELRWTKAAVPSSARLTSRYQLLYRSGLVTLVKAVGLLIRIADAVRGTRRFRKTASFLTLAAGYALPSIILTQGNRSADRAENYFAFASGNQNAAGNGKAGKQVPPRPPKTLSVLKWVAMAGLAAAAAAIVLKPRKAY